MTYWTYCWHRSLRQTARGGFNPGSRMFGRRVNPLARTGIYTTHRDDKRGGPISVGSHNRMFQRSMRRVGRTGTYHIEHFYRNGSRVAPIPVESHNRMIQRSMHRVGRNCNNKPSGPQRGKHNLTKSDREEWHNHLALRISSSIHQLEWRRRR